MTTSFPCTACGKPIRYSASKCPHCGSIVTRDDIKARAGESTFDGNALLGCVGIPTLIAFAAYAIAITGPSDAERRASDLKLAEEYELRERNSRFACFEYGLDSACDEIDDHAELARYYRQRVNEADASQ